MIRIEGIPVVTARLADAEKAKSTQTGNKRRRTSKIDVDGKAPLAIRCVLLGTGKISGFEPNRTPSLHPVLWR